MENDALRSRPTVAVIGAGLSGLACARTLIDNGIDITVFEKSRGIGGRMATRRTAEGPRFDHGAQYFTVREERFERCVLSWMQDGIVAPWEGRICTLTNGGIEWKQQTTPRFVGVPGMNAVCRHLAADVNVRLRTLVRPPDFEQGIWRLRDELERPLGDFDYVVTSAPAPQSAELLTPVRELHQQAMSAKMHGCWAVLLAFDHSLGLPFDGAFVHDSPLSWVARNDSKPQRGKGEEPWVLHASPEWSGGHLANEPTEVLPLLLDAFWQATDFAPRKPKLAISHLWRYAIPLEPLDKRCLFDEELRIGACGDWCSGPRVEGAFLSGMALADRLLSCVTKSSTARPNDT